MSTKEEVRRFLADFKTKMKVFEIIYRDDRGKNTKALLDYEISRTKRREVIENLLVENYSEGPNDDKLYGIATMWIFGVEVKGIEFYIKISYGRENESVICISFHPSEKPMAYPFKQI